MKVHPAALSTGFVKRAVLCLRLKQTGPRLNLNIFPHSRGTVYFAAIDSVVYGGEICECLIFPDAVSFAAAGL